MTKKKFFAPYTLAASLMDNLLDLYTYAALGLNADLDNDEHYQEMTDEGITYAKNKFQQIAEEFENIFNIKWAWYYNEEESDTE